MNMTAQAPSYNAKLFNSNQRKQLALKSLSQALPVATIAQDNQVSRKFVYQQQHKAKQAVNDAFAPIVQPNEKVLFYLPVTLSWLYQLILCLVLHCRATHRGVQKLLGDAFDHAVSLGTLHNLVEDAKSKAKNINQQQDLSHIKLAAQDELFQHNKPVLAGVDIPSLYCYLLSQENRRDTDTWATHLLDLEKQGLSPERVFGDDADGLRAGHKLVFPKVPYDLDNFHIIKSLMDCRRYFRNSLKSAITNRKTLQKKVDKGLLTKKYESYQDSLTIALAKEKSMRSFSQSVDTLVNWMQHDVLNMPGLEPTSRDEVFDFILEEFEKLAKQHPHRLQAICTSLANQKPFLLAFTGVLDNKFQAIADEFVYPLETIWQMCALQRCQHSSDRYAIRSLPLQDYLGADFDDIEDAVLNALDTTERTSSMVENLNSRLSPYFFLRREIGFGYLDLLQFYLNHTPFLRSARESRQGKTPTEILTGHSHPHWLEMLGYQRFKKAA